MIAFAKGKHYLYSDCIRPVVMTPDLVIGVTVTQAGTLTCVHVSVCVCMTVICAKCVSVCINVT